MYFCYWSGFPQFFCPENPSNPCAKSVACCISSVHLFVRSHAIFILCISCKRDGSRWTPKFITSSPTFTFHSPPSSVSSPLLSCNYLFHQQLPKSIRILISSTKTTYWTVYLASSLHPTKESALSIEPHFQTRGPVGLETVFQIKKLAKN